MLQLPDLPEGLQWKVSVNTSVEYVDGRNMEEFTDFRERRLINIPPRTVVVLEAEQCRDTQQDIQNIRRAELEAAYDALL